MASAVVMAAVRCVNSGGGLWPLSASVRGRGRGSVGDTGMVSVPETQLMGDAPSLVATRGSMEPRVGCALGKETAGSRVRASLVGQLVLFLQGLRPSLCPGAAPAKEGGGALEFRRRGSGAMGRFVADAKTERLGARLLPFLPGPLQSDWSSCRFCLLGGTHCRARWRFGGPQVVIGQFCGHLAPPFLYRRDGADLIRLLHSHSGRSW